jgi:2-polyprenyl-6-methoxyphenol hydroxylase-like FAD-dependent oxidoreductase
MSRVLIVGAGPCGASLAWLLASRGIEVELLERQLDFAREFRGEVLMPSGVEALHEMGLGDVLESVPREMLPGIEAYLNGERRFEVTFDGDAFAECPPQAISQPPLLEAICAKASAAFPHFRLRRGATAKSLSIEDGRVAGARVRAADGESELRADLVIGTDGRASVVRRQGGFESQEVSPPLDVVWFKIRCPRDLRFARSYAGRGNLLLCYRAPGDLLQVAWVIIKGSFGSLKARPIEEWGAQMADHISPDLAEHIQANMDALTRPFLLDSVSDRAKTWSRPGAMLLGDAAHTMSPVGGQGVNIALRDAVVAANHLVPVLTKGATPDAEALSEAMRAIERERMVEVERIQRIQSMPPRVGFNQPRLGEPLRRIAFGLLSRPGFRSFIAPRSTEIAFGVTDVRLTV